MTQNLGKLKITHNDKDHKYTLWRTNERDEWERYHEYSEGCVDVEDYEDWCYWSVDTEILETIMKLVNEGYTFVGTERIEYEE